MKKDKPSKGFSMKDMVLDNQSPQKVEKTKVLSALDSVDIVEFAKEVSEYNKNISNFDSDYSDMIPNGYQVLVRLFAKEPKLENGLYHYNSPQIAVQTTSGVGVKEYVNSPYPFTKKAIVVAVSPRLESEYTPGELVQITDIPVVCPYPGQKDVIPVYSFLHHEYDDILPPYSVTHKHFGYFMIPENIINSKLTK